MGTTTANPHDTVSNHPWLINDENGQTTYRYTLDGQIIRFEPRHDDADSHDINNSGAT